MLFSFLWKNIDRDEKVKFESKLEDTLFNDLKIQKFLESIFDNSSDVDEMIEIMKLVPKLEDILYRQEILTDILTDKENDFEVLYYDLIDLVSIYTSYKEAIENIKKRLFFLMYCYHYFTFLDKVKNVLIKKNVCSSGLKELIVLITQVLDDEERIKKFKTIKSYYDYIVKNLKFNVEFHDEAPYYELSFDNLDNLEDNLLDIAKDLNCDLIKVARQGMRKELNPYFLHAAISNNPELYQALKDFFEENRESLVDDLSYMVSEFKYMISLKKMFLHYKNIPFCKVEVNSKNETIIDSAYDVSLLGSKNDNKIEIVPNDFICNDKENISFILGVNSGGKTCYLRSIGANYVYFITSGYMFCKKAIVYPVKYIFTHFPNEENYSFGEGRLRDEIKRLDNIKNYFSLDSISFLNETFSSTSEEKACILTKKLLSDIGTTKAKVMYVTHQYKIFEEIEDSRISFYTPVVTEGIMNVRTYKIKKVEKKLLSYVDDILIKHGLTKEQLLNKRTMNNKLEDTNE